MMKSRTCSGSRAVGALGAVAAALLLWGAAAAAAAEPTVIELTQTPCQFLQPENGVDHMYRSSRKADCDAINAKTGAARLAVAKPLVLKPGRYIFRVTNKNVPYDLGFYLRGTGLSWITLPKVSGGGLKPGVTKDYVIDLVAGDYVYSCPLNPTPDYPLEVRG